MPGLTCNACNKELQDDAEQKLHYKSEWHRYNLKRKVACVPGVTESLFLARQSALAEERKKLSKTPMLYSCVYCGKAYRSSKAHAQHLQSRAHILRASQRPIDRDESAIVKLMKLTDESKLPTPRRQVGDVESEDSGDEWIEVDSDDSADEASKSLTGLTVTELGSNDKMDEDEDDRGSKHAEVDPCCCFMCDQRLCTLDNCIFHLHKQHGFFVPDVEYLKDPEGLLTYLGLKVRRDFMCLYCNGGHHPFNSLEAVRKHMEAKSHCKVHYGDADDDDGELEDFYDYSSSYVDDHGKQLVAQDAVMNTVELEGAGSELIITRRTSDGISTKTLGSREYVKYYRQKPRPSMTDGAAIAAAVAKRYRSMGLPTAASKEGWARMKVLKVMNRSGVEQMRSKIGLKSNVIRNLPKNVPY